MFDLHFQVCIRLDAIADFPVGVAGGSVGPAPQLGPNLSERPIREDSGQVGRHIASESGLPRSRSGIELLWRQGPTTCHSLDDLVDGQHPLTFPDQRLQAPARQ